MRPRRVMLVRVSSLVKPRLMVRHVFEVHCVGNHVLIEGVSRSMHSKILSSPSLTHFVGWQWSNQLALGPIGLMYCLLLLKSFVLVLLLQWIAVALCFQSFTSFPTCQRVFCLASQIAASAHLPSNPEFNLYLTVASLQLNFLSVAYS